MSIGLKDRNTRLTYYRKWREKHPEYRKNYYLKNREKALKDRKKYYQEHYSEHYAYCKKYYKENSERITKHLRERFKNDSLYKLRINLRNRIKQAMVGITKSKSTKEILGCDFKEAKRWIESQFKDGMTWKNHGSIWEIDHVIPLSTAKTPEKLYELSNYKNLQPLWWKENRRKYNKIYVEK